MVLTVLITLVAGLLLISLVVWLLMSLRQPSYRVQRRQVLRLLLAIEAGEARHKDWLVFVGVPLRHDPWLEDFRHRCAALEDVHLLGDNSGHLFDQTGRRKLARLRAELEANLEGH